MLVRNTVSGQEADIPAEKSIGHPWFGRFYVPATKAKPEVLAQPYEIDENGERKIIAVDGAQPASADGKDSIAKVDTQPIDVQPVGDVKPKPAAKKVEK